MHASTEGLLKSLSDNGMSPNTIRGYRADLEGFLHWISSDSQRTNGTSLEQQAKEYLNHLRSEGAAPRTIQRKISALRAYGRHVGIPSMLADYRPPKPARPTPHPLPEGINGVLDMVAAAPTEEHKALIAFCGLAGLRVSEARSVTPSCIDPAEMTIYVIGKGDKHRLIPMGTTAWHFIQPGWSASVARDQTGDSPIVNLSDRGARKFLKRIGCKVGLTRNVSSHDLRATFATAAYTKTKDLRAVQELLGHSSSQTTEVYTGVSMDAMRVAAAVI